MVEGKKTYEFLKKASSTITLKDVDVASSFVMVVLDQEQNNRQIASDLENALKSEYLSLETRNDIQNAIFEHQNVANKFNSLLDEFWFYQKVIEISKQAQ